MSPGWPGCRTRRSPGCSTTTPTSGRRPRARVRAAIAELGYRPNRAARALVTGRSQLIGVVALNTTLYGPASLLAAFEQAAAAAGFAVSVGSVRQLDRESISAVRRAPPGPAGGRDRGDRPGGVGDRGAGRAAHRHPAGDHRRRPAPARPPGSPSTRRPGPARPPRTCSTPGTGRSGTSRARRTGSTAPAASRAGRRPCARPGPRCRRWCRRTGRPRPATGSGSMLARMPEVTAIFAANDHLALGPAAGAARAGPPRAARREHRRVRRRARRRATSSRR